jgi:hypothetical protein
MARSTSFQLPTSYVDDINFATTELPSYHPYFKTNAIVGNPQGNAISPVVWYYKHPLICNEPKTMVIPGTVTRGLRAKEKKEEDSEKKRQMKEHLEEEMKNAQKMEEQRLKRCQKKKE